MRTPVIFFSVLSAPIFLTAGASAQVRADPPKLQTEYLGPDVLRDAIDEAVAAGQIAVPVAPALVPSVALSSMGGSNPTPCLTQAQIWTFEDSAQVLQSNFSNGELFQLMSDAANDLIAANGDNYDFIGYWVNSTPDHTIGAAFYLGLFNDTQGLGLDPADFRAAVGLGSNRVDGYVMMWNVNSNFWQEGTGSNANFTRLALGQEFEHRWGMFLPDLLDGRQLQGNNGGCGRAAHWNFRVDGQGSGMEIGEWVGSNPATRVGGSLNFNTDIPGGVFSHTDLYLMGYDSPAEMDMGNSELRYMDTSNCSPSYNGTVSSFSSADIVASAGLRVPSSVNEQKNYRTAWIMLHQPGDAPSNSELDKAIGILEQHQTDWHDSTLQKGIMNNTVFEDCNCNGVPDGEDISTGVSEDRNSNNLPDECEQLGVAYCSPSVPNSSGASAAMTAIGSRVVADNDVILVASDLPANQFGYFLTSRAQAFILMPGGSQGNLCLGTNIARFVVQAQNSGSSGSIDIVVDVTSLPPPVQSSIFSGETWNFQAWFRDGNPNPTSNFTDGVSILFE